MTLIKYTGCLVTGFPIRMVKFRIRIKPVKYDHIIWNYELAHSLTLFDCIFLHNFRTTLKIAKFFSQTCFPCTLRTSWNLRYKFTNKQAPVMKYFVLDYLAKCLRNWPSCNQFFNVKFQAIGMTLSAQRFGGFLTDILMLLKAEVSHGRRLSHLRWHSIEIVR